jgi:glycosyltransferase involved in cell wall biosynthesis
LSQTFADFRYLIVDNGCTDKTADILREYAERDARIELVRLDRNRNDGEYVRLMSECLCDVSTEYVCSLDGDDWYAPTFLEETYGLALKNDADIVAAQSVCCSEDNPSTVSPPRNFCRTFVAKDRKDILQLFALVPAELSLWGKLFRTKKILVDFDVSKGVRHFWVADKAMFTNGVDKSECFVVSDKILHCYTLRSYSSWHPLNLSEVTVSYYFWFDAVLSLIRNEGLDSPDNLHPLMSVMLKGAFLYDILLTSVVAEENRATAKENMATIEKALAEHGVEEIFETDRAFREAKRKFHDMKRRIMGDSIPENAEGRH